MKNSLKRHPKVKLFFCWFGIAFSILSIIQAIFWLISFQSFKKPKHHNLIEFKFPQNLTDDCNYAYCNGIKKPDYFSSNGKIAVLMNQLMKRNYELKNRMCQKIKNHKQKSIVDLENLKTIKIHSNLQPWFDINHSNDFYGRKCQFPCAKTNNIKEADIIVANSGSYDYGGDIELVKRLKTENPGKAIAYIGFEPYGMSSRLNIINQLRELSDYMIHHIPFSEVGVSDSLNIRIQRANNNNLPEEIFFAFNKENDPKDPVVLGRYKEKLIDNYRNKKNQKAIASNFVSNCNSEIRTSYINALEELVTIDNYGKGECFKSRKQTSEYITPEVAKIIPGRYTQKKYIQQFYYFAISFENDILPGYYTEKLVDGIENKFSIPIYLGAPEIKDLWFSNIPKKYWDRILIFANEYSSPEELVHRLKYLMQNEEAYLEYFQWRLDGYSLSYGTNPKISGAYDDDESWFCRLCEYHHFGKRFCHNNNYKKKHMSHGYL